MNLRLLAIFLIWIGLAHLGCEKGASSSGGSSSSGGEVEHASVSPLFTEVTERVGLAFRHEAGIEGSFFMPEIVGAGAAMFDFDGDGDLDIYLINGSHHHALSLGKAATEPEPVNRLFRQEGDGTFVDITEASGLGDRGFGVGVAIGDYDNDGDADVYVTNYGADVLFRNNGDGSFAEVTVLAGLGNERWACSAAFFDYDLDGFLDLYVANYLHYPGLKVCSDDAGRPEYCGPRASPPTPDVLYHNNGDGTFSDVSAATGIGAVTGRGLGVLCDDFDGDGWPDIYVANDGEANFLWINDGKGGFVESAIMLGVALNAFANTEASMGVAAGDLDDDGDIDLFMTHLALETNTLYRNDGTGNFDDITALTGLGASSLRATGFGAAFLDFDNDGGLDLAVANGRVSRKETPTGAASSDSLGAYAEANVLYHHEGVLRFEKVGDEGGGFGVSVEVSRGLVIGDIDGDGGQDILVTNCDGPARLYRNTAADRGHWLVVRAWDPALKRDAYGARVSIEVNGKKLHRTVNPGYSYASSGDPRAHFGLGEATAVGHIEIRWPGGEVERYEGVEVDQIVTLLRSVAPGIPGIPGTDE